MNTDKETDTFDIAFDMEGKHYKGWVTPSNKLNDKGLPTSFHVVLDEVFFGNVSNDGNTWTVDEWRPENLVQQVGKFIEEWYE